MILDTLQHPTEMKSLHGFSSLHVPTFLRMTINWERWVGRKRKKSFCDTVHFNANMKKEENRQNVGFKLCGIKTGDRE